MNKELVLDAWTVVGWLRRQPPAVAHVRSLWEAVKLGELRLAMNIVNLGEVFYTTVRYEGRTFALGAIASFRSRIVLVAASEPLTLHAADLKAGRGISYADAFAAATAIERKAALVTGDPELRRLAERIPDLRLHWIGR